MFDSLAHMYMTAARVDRLLEADLRHRDPRTTRHLLALHGFGAADPAPPHRRSRPRLFAARKSR